MDIYSKIDSDRFGIKIGKITEEFFDDKCDLNEKIQLIYDSGFDMIIARIDYNNINIINNLEKNGFIIEDIQQTLYYPFINGIILPKKNDTLKIREFNLSDTETLIKLAKISFNGYGHYFADNKLDKVKCMEVYVDWAYNMCVDKNVADKIFVCEIDKKVRGFLSFKTQLSGDKKIAVGVMGAVDPDYRNIGIFPNIVITGLEWGLNENFEWEEHNVLINNFPVNKSFVKIGFRPNKIMITLHGWIDEITKKII